VFDLYSEHVKSASTCQVHAEDTHTQAYTHSNKTIQTYIKHQNKLFDENVCDTNYILQSAK
jgi:hypothetical protein